MMHVIPYVIDGMRPEQLEEFLLSHEWLHAIYTALVTTGGNHA